MLQSRVFVAIRTVAVRMMPSAQGVTVVNLPIASPLHWGNVFSSEEDDDAFSYAMTAFAPSISDTQLMLILLMLAGDDWMEYESSISQTC
jgi:hypothetical protein